DVVNQWNHVAATFDYAGPGTGTWKLYLNGNLENQLFVGWSPRADSIQHFAIGTALTSAGAAAGFFGGQIDEVRVWNYARTQTQIQATMRRPLTSATGLL